MTITVDPLFNFTNIDYAVHAPYFIAATAGA